jgi:hypothetical protein
VLALEKSDVLISEKKEKKSTTPNKNLLFPHRHPHSHFYDFSEFGKGMPVYSSYPKARLRF